MCDPDGSQTYALKINEEQSITIKDMFEKRKSFGTTRLPTSSFLTVDRPSRRVR